MGKSIYSVCMFFSLWVCNDTAATSSRTLSVLLAPQGFRLLLLRLEMEMENATSVCHAGPALGPKKSHCQEVKGRAPCGAQMPSSGSTRPFEAEQVACANQVYRSCVRLLFRAYKTGALVTIENPVRSWLWPLLAILIKEHGPQSFVDWYFSLQDYDFDVCMFGSQGTPGVFEGLQRACAHLLWKPTRMAAKEEAEYTPGLCRFLCIGPLQL